MLIRKLPSCLRQKLKTQLPIQFLHNPPMLDFPSKHQQSCTRRYQNNSDPQITTMIKPTGNTAPNTNLQRPGGKPAAAIPALQFQLTFHRMQCKHLQGILKLQEMQLKDQFFLHRYLRDS